MPLRVSPPPPPHVSSLAIAASAPGHRVWDKPRSATPLCMFASRRNCHAATHTQVLNVHPFLAWCCAIWRGDNSSLLDTGNASHTTPHGSLAPRSVSDATRQLAAMRPSFWLKAFSCCAVGTPGANSASTGSALESSRCSCSNASNSGSIASNSAAAAREEVPPQRNTDPRAQSGSLARSVPLPTKRAAASNGSALKSPHTTRATLVWEFDSVST
mmetsp:Transcript_15725/g.51630  ORF Transcript_15725/g.51630 Transcript_15725/m.51630 type:complete len:215 (-) Transcript_15725:437-1081(-)